MSAFTDNFSPNDFHALSMDIENSIQNQNSVAINSRDAAWLRSAISRAYYAAFLSLRVSLIDSHRWPQLEGFSTDPHKNMGIILFNLPSAFKHTANSFKNLRKRRNHADYDIPPQFLTTLQHVETSNKEAEKIIYQVPIIANYFQTNPP